MASKSSSERRPSARAVAYRRFLGCCWIVLVWCSGATAADSQPLRAALISAGDVAADRMDELKDDGMNAIVIVLAATTDEKRQIEQAAAEQVRGSPFDLYYWIEVARCPELADQRPKWMASQQTHPKWRRLFPDTAVPNKDEVVKTYPWVSILSRETFTAQLLRVQKLLTDLPRPAGVFLNDLQGAPSACGCGNILCRWTSDYGKRRTTIPLNEDAAASFVAAVRKSLPNSKVFPVWTTECEQHDGAKDGACAGVGCFEGICWQSYTAQLAPLEQTCSQLGVLLPYREFGRDLQIYGQQAGWIRHAVQSFDTMPRKYGRPSVESSRLITILQGWDVDESQIANQVRIATESAVAGYVVAYTKIDQSWEPRLVPWP